MFHRTLPMPFKIKISTYEYFLKCTFVCVCFCIGCMLYRNI